MEKHIRKLVRYFLMEEMLVNSNEDKKLSQPKTDEEFDKNTSTPKKRPKK